MAGKRKKHEVRKKREDGRMMSLAGRLMQNGLGKYVSAEGDDERRGCASERRNTFRNYAARRKGK